jgi:hypothetical protein
MQIKGKNIRSLAKYFPQIGDGKPFRVGIPVTGMEAKLEELGFPQPLEEGTSILPAIVGKVSMFNAEGRDLVRKDLPMITKSRMIYTTTYDWHGNPHSGFQYRDYKAYPREHVDGPEEEIILLRHNADLIAVSDVLFAKPEGDTKALHVINLFLECFGEGQLLHSNIEPIIKIKKVHWKILPPGVYPWDKAKSYVREVTRHLQDSERAVVDHRIQLITQNEPDFLAVGTGGFDGYFVFGFTKKGLFVLESNHFDNATYVLKSDWQKLSSLTKKEILTGQLHHDRLIHNRNWSWNLRNVLDGKPIR